MRVLAVILAFCLAGCGGGGGGSTQALPTTAVMRQVQTGNQAQYSVSGTVTNGGEPVPITGTARMTVYGSAEVPRYGGTPYRVLRELQVTGNGYTEANTSYLLYERMANGDVYLTGISADTTERITSTTAPPLDMPGTLRVGDAWAYEATYDTGRTERCASQVVGVETVSGQVAFRVHSSLSDGERTEITDSWEVPAWGCPVKGTTEITAGAYHLSLSMTLLSKNF